jgi:hypothetical protein
MLRVLLLLGVAWTLSATAASAQTTYTVTNTNDSGPGSLRQAMNDANDASGTPADVIAFDISGSGPHVIQPQTALPTLSDPVKVDGTMEPDYSGTPVVVIDGGPANLSVGFQISGGFSEIRGLAIVNVVGTGSTFTRSISMFTAGRNLVEACYIGVEPDGTTPAGNGGLGSGIQISNGSQQNVIRGNVIADMNQVAISLETIDNQVVGNVIGATADGRTGLNGGTGLGIAVRADFNVIGGTSTSERNLLADLSTGIRIRTGRGTIIEGNYIGTNAFDDDLGLSGVGIYLTDTAELSIIGYGYADGIAGTADRSNVIAYNSRGIWMDGTTGDGNAARGNVLYQNTNLGIDLGSLGATANDSGDGDEGANRLQNFPEISDAFYDGSEVAVTYSVPTDPSFASYPLDVDFYAADADDEEGRTFLFTDRYTETDYNNGPSVSVLAPVSSSIVSSSDDILATATDADGNTSEFSVSPVVLPVELTSFTAAVDGDDVAVDWGTASETGNAGFYVERAVGDGAFADQGFVEGAGTTTETQRYRFTDRSVPGDAQTLRYRLRQVDVDGAATISREVVVERRTAETLQMHAAAPNPARNAATLRYELPRAGDVRITAYNLLGQRIAILADDRQSAGPNQLRVDASGWPSGTYLIRLTAGTEVVTRRLVVVR